MPPARPHKARWGHLAFYLLPLALSLGACSLFFTEGDPYPDAEGDGGLPMAPQTFEEEFPFVGLFPLGEGRYRATLTVPVGAGAAMVVQLEAVCACLKGETPSAAVHLDADGGLVFNNKVDAAAQPWSDTIGNFRQVEDLLVATGTEADLRQIFNAIDERYNSGPLIEIQAAVTENSTNEDFERGVTQIASDKPIFQDAQGTTFLNALGGSFPASSNPTVTGSGLGGAFQLGLLDSSFNLNAAIQILSKEGLVDVVSQPSIVTRNGVTAVVDSTEKVPFLDIQTLSLTGAATFKIGFNDIGVKLRVTPFLVGVDTIHLVISVEVSRFGQDFVIGTDGNNQPIISPSLSTRTANTEVYVKSGQSVVIGGLRLTQKNTVENKIPFLGDLPLLGWLFSSKSTGESKTNVTFMITPVLKRRATIEPIGDVYDPFADSADSGAE